MLDLQELRNFSLASRAALFKAMFGKPMSRQKVLKFYQESKVHYGKPTRLFNRAINNQSQLDVLRSAFKKRLLVLLSDLNNRIFYIDETSFNAQEQPVKCWQFKAQPLKFAIPIKRPHNLTMFGAVGN